MDDNVHMQNSVQFAYELQRKGKPFEMMVYATERHGFADPLLIKLTGAIGGVRALGIRGCSVSMPFKQDVLALVDHVEESARAINAVNTVVNDDGVLTASNTDYIAVQRLIVKR